jgi:hypothetical protein
MADQQPSRTARDGVTRTPTIIVSLAAGGTGTMTSRAPLVVDIDAAAPTAAQQAALRRYVAAKFAAPADLSAVGDSTRTAPPATEETR